MDDPLCAVGQEHCLRERETTKGNDAHNGAWRRDPLGRLGDPSLHSKHHFDFNYNTAVTSKFFT